MISLSLPRSRNTCGWSNGGLAPTHMNSCEPISMTGTPASLWKWGTTRSAIEVTFSLAMRAEETQHTLAKLRAPYRRSGLISIVPAFAFRHSHHVAKHPLCECQNQRGDRQTLLLVGFCI